MSVSAISGTEAWVLGATTCGTARCLRLLHTNDGFAHTNYLPHDPPAGVSVVRFANPQDGFAVVGRPRLHGNVQEIWTTHDGGTSWARRALNGSPVSLVTAGPRVYLITCSGAEPDCLTASTLLAGGTTGELLPMASLGALPYVASVAVHAGAVRVVTHAGLMGSDDGGPLTLRPAPCGETQLPKMFNPVRVLGTVTFDSAGRLFASCLGGVAAGSQSKVLVTSTDGGATWAQSLTQPPPSGDGASLAAAGPGQVTLTAVSGASWLYRTGDNGRTWTTAYTNPDQGGFADLGFVDAVHGFAIDE